MRNWPKFRIRKPRGTSGLQIGLLISIGILGGYYIWNPLILESVEAARNKSTLENSEEST